MEKFNLNRKRILDTMLAASYYTNGITTIISSSARDFQIYQVFKIMDPASDD